MPVQQDLAALPTTKKLFLGSAVLLLVDSFLPWYHVSFGGVSVSEGGWHQFGSITWIVLIALLVWEGVRIAGAAPIEGRRADLFSSVGALAVVVLGVIFVLQRISDGSLGFGFFLGVILLVGLGYSAFQTFQASGGAEAVRHEVDERRKPPVV
ncbi:hypothetical protein AB0L40_14270 [Patulibacter sp. NPDC049589]|uniref:hypothetical protein n=1 Tax=Patulibacter sp. NPDC049589 TaxID=3154731 RepID=UPI0034197787